MKKHAGVFAAVFFALAALSLKPWLMDFALDDDWAYALPVKILRDGGLLALTNWSPHTQILQIFWGWLWSLPFGFSPGALKLSTLFLATGGVWLFYKLLRKLEVEEYAALAGALCLAFNPLFFLLSNTFMTDVPYLVLVLASLLAFLRWRKGEPKELAVCALLSAAATLVHQTGLLLPAAFSLALLLEGRQNLKTLFRLWLPTVTAIGCWWFWIHHNGSTPAVFNAMGKDALFYYSSPLLVAKETALRLAHTALYCGLFASPLAAALICDTALRKTLRENKALLAVGLLATVALFSFALSSGGVTAVGNDINAVGLGTITISGDKASGFLALPFLWPALHLAAALSAVILVAAFASGRQLSSGMKTVLLVFGLQFAVTVAMRNFFDRYFLYMLPLPLAFAVMELAARKTPLKPAFLALALLGAFSWACTADYLDWNKAKWQLAHAAQNYGIAPDEVTAGFDYDGWHTYQKNNAAGGKTDSSDEWSWRDMSKMKAAVIFSVPPEKAGDVLERLDYHTPLAPNSGGRLFLVKVRAGEFIADGGQPDLQK